MSSDLDDLARAAADALVSAMVTDSWETVKRRFAALAGHERRLDAARDELAATSGANRDRERLVQARAWSTRLRDALEDDPGAAEGLRALLAELDTATPTAAPASQHAQADHGSQAVNVGGNITGNTGEVYVGVGKVDKRKINIALAPFLFLINATKKLIAAHGAGSVAAITVVVLGTAAVTGWQAHWPPALFGGATAQAQPTVQALRWSAIDAPLPSDAASSSTSRFDADLLGLSCPADGACIATGFYTSHGYDSGILVETVSRGTWAAQLGPPLPSDAASPPNPLLAGVTCSSPADCTAYGTYTAGGDAGVGLIETLSRGTWTSRRLPLPGDAGRDQQMALWGLACPASVDCVAVGSNSYDNSSTGAVAESRALIQTLVNGIWTPAEAPLPADAVKTGDHAQLLYVACTSPGACTAVGSYTDTQGNTQGLIETFANGTWTPAKAPLPEDAAAHQNATLFGITCTAPGACIAVGRYVGPGRTNQGLIETQTNGTDIPSKAPGLPQQRGAELYSITCTAPGSCITVGDYSATGGSVGLIETLANGTWTAAAAPLPANAARTSRTVYLNEVACATARYCVAVGSYTNGGMGTEALIETTSAGGAKTASPPPSPLSSPPPSPSPADSNPATTFSDGSRVEITSGGGGPGNVHVTLRITAGQSGLALGGLGTFQIQPVDSNGQDPWSSPESPQFYNPSDTSASHPEGPPDLQPGQSVCVVQTFDDPSNPQEPANNSGWTISMTLGNGTAGNVTLPAGGGAGPYCNID
jgi:hypothetical protein